MNKINWVFLIELYAIVFTVSIVTTYFEVNQGMQLILFAVIGFNASKLLSYIHGKPMTLIDNDENDYGSKE